MIYLDNNATTPVDPRVLAAMLPYFGERFGSAGGASHLFDREAQKAVEYSRGIIASELNAEPEEIIFTSGTTESVNLAIKGVCARAPQGKNHLVTQATEHQAVLDTCAALARQGWNITILKVDGRGRVAPEDVARSITPATALVAVMHVNNEIGTIQSVEEIGTICRERGVYFFIDAAQGFGKLPIDVRTMHIDLLAATAHKIYGPKGVGFLYVNRMGPKVDIAGQISGEGQEQGYRSGAVPVPLVVGFGEAARVAVGEREEESRRIAALRDMMIDRIGTAFPEAILNGDRERRIFNNVNFCFPGIEAESLLMKMKGIACSTGSACSSAHLEPSHVIKALGRSHELANSAVRFSLGRFNTEEEVDRAIEEITASVLSLHRRQRRVAAAQ